MIINSVLNYISIMFTQSVCVCVRVYVYESVCVHMYHVCSVCAHCNSSAYVLYVSMYCMYVCVCTQLYNAPLVHVN